MLTRLQLRDLVIVDRAELEFGAGLSALTGETGAGKSIVVDALLLIAGGRSAGDIVRQGAERAEIAANFAALPPAARQWLTEQSIEHDDEVILRRVIGADGRSRAYINGQLVVLQNLRELAELLIEIHGQQEFQHLVRRGAQRELLDEHVDAAPLLVGLEEIYGRYRTCRRDHDGLKAAAENRDARLDILRYQLTELQAEVTTAAAIEGVFLEQKRISGRGRLGSAARAALVAAYDADGASAHDLLARAQAALRAVGDADPELAQSAALLGEATILTNEAAGLLRHYLDALDIEPARQEEIERQAAALEGLARKHRLGVLELPALVTRMQAELAALENAEHGLTQLERQLAALAADYRAAAAALTAARLRAAAELAAQITALMQSLGMAGGRFAVTVLPLTDREFGPHGMDDIEFQVSANPGQPLKPLAKVASGGELSRISLAVQVAAAAKSAAVAMVFDEVDSGIGGAIAEIVGRQLRALGERSQVLCVTHLPQVAAQAHAQYQVVKITDGVTRTAVRSLNPAERVEEIARMLGGVNVTDQARAHAREMLEANTGPKKKRRRA